MPTVQRLLDVPADVPLDALHEILQVALGWTDSHLHQFVMGDRRYGFADEDADPDEQDESTATLADLPETFISLYDFGDGWEHDVEQLGPGADRPGCADGEGGCPPEDCGGVHGYAGMLEALADTNHPDHQGVIEWVGDQLIPFDRDRTDERVRHVIYARHGAR